MPSEQQSASSDVVLQIARDLTASIAGADRYGRLLEALRRLIPYDAACLMRLEGDELVPLAARGLADEALVRRYRRRLHPRLDAILGSAEPVLFPADSDLPDPFEGLLRDDAAALGHIHACLGCALADDGEVVGALTADALAPRAFDHVDRRTLATVGALAAAALRTTALVEKLEQALERQGRVARDLQRSADLQGGGELVGKGEGLRALQEEMALVAGTDLPVLITGETGVGKELVARQLHRASSRAEQPLIEVNCAALPESIAESELFGHVRGAFTGAVADRLGKFEVAHQGTLLLDEVGELPMLLQPKLLRALQQGEIQRVGSDRVHRVDVRVIAMTNRDLEREVAEGRFRADLYHRLAAYPLRVPPLRERRDDVPLLAAHFLDAWRRRLGLGPLRFSEEARALLAAADWPGNVRELENVVSRAVLRASRGQRRADVLVIGPESLGLDVEPLREAASPSVRPALAAPPLTLEQQTDELQRRLIQEAVARHGGNWAAAARELGVHRSNLHHRARRLGLKAPRRASATARDDGPARRTE